MHTDDTQGAATEASRIRFGEVTLSCNKHANVDGRCSVCGSPEPMFNKYPDPEFAADLFAAVENAIEKGIWQ